jgi:hypothetical protein
MAITRKQIEAGLKVEPWVKITIAKIVISNDGRTRKTEFMYCYDIRRDMMDRWIWVIDWRIARYICQDPRHRYDKSYTFYDRKFGIDMDMLGTYHKYVSAKAKVTETRNKIDKWVAGYVPTLMDPTPYSTDAYKNAMCKLRTYESAVIALADELEKDTNQAALAVEKQ